MNASNERPSERSLNNAPNGTPNPAPEKVLGRRRLMSGPWRHPSFVRVWLGQVFAQSANRIFQISVIWWIMTEASGVSSGTLTAFFLIACAAPAVLFARGIGSVIDRANPRSVLSSAVAIASLVMWTAAGGFAFGLFSPLVIIGIGLSIASLHAFYDPCLQRGLGRLVEAEEMPSAIAIVSSTQSLANFGGAVLGAFLMGLVGMGWLLVIVGSAYLLAALLTISARFNAASEKGNSATTDATASASQTSGGAASRTTNSEEKTSVLATYPLLKRVLIGFGFVNFFTAPVLIVLPLYVRNVLGGDAIDLGWLEASVWLGLVAGTIAAPTLTKKLSALQTGTLMMVSIGAALLAPGLIASQPLYQAALFTVGAALGMNNLRFIALFQQTVADDVKGRFFAMVSAVVNFTMPISFLTFGFLGDRVSPQWLCLFQGIGVLALSGYFLLLERSGVPLKQADLNTGVHHAS